jgi:hypothetical protein
MTTSGAHDAPQVPHKRPRPSGARRGIVYRDAGEGGQDDGDVARRGAVGSGGSNGGGGAAEEERRAHWAAELNTALARYQDKRRRGAHRRENRRRAIVKQRRQEKAIWATQAALDGDDVGGQVYTCTTGVVVAVYF